MIIGWGPPLVGAVIILSLTILILKYPIKIKSNRCPLHLGGRGENPDFRKQAFFSRHDHNKNIDILSLGHVGFGTTSFQTSPCGLKRIQICIRPSRARREDSGRVSVEIAYESKALDIPIRLNQTMIQMRSASVETALTHCQVRL